MQLIQRAVDIHDCRSRWNPVLRRKADCTHEGQHCEECDANEIHSFHVVKICDEKLGELMLILW
jgi:hypothetical protein